MEKVKEFLKKHGKKIGIGLVVVLVIVAIVKKLKNGKKKSNPFNR